MIDKATAERIKDAADIVEVVGDYVHLTRRGANYMGLCPFHNERTPSFSVNRARNFCYCFSCHKGGSPVNFIMEKEGIGYQDALRQLARKYGIKIEERELTDAEKQAQSQREAMFVANEWAMEKFRHFLTDTDEGRNVGLAYLYQRGITDEAIKHFRLGYSPDANVLEALACKEGYNPEILVELGLLGKGEHDRKYDRFRGRVMYPVLNAAGKVVAFGGRDLKGAKAKYINSPESPIYHKSNELYGLHQARSEMGRSDQSFLVEGYMDVIGLWQVGLTNVIASSGTALTDAQIALIHRFTHNVTLVYDGDPAGIKASMRGIDMLLAQNMDIKVLLLPDGHDPDSFARAVAPEECRNYFNDKSTDFITFKTQVLLQDANDPIKRTQAARSIVESLGSIADKIKRNVYIQTCSRLLGIDEQILSYEADVHAQKLAMKRPGSEPRGSAVSQPESVQPAQPAQKPETPAVPVKPTPLIRLERALMRLCVRYGMAAIEPPEEDYADNEAPMLVLDYVNSELTADGIEFTDPVCAELLKESLSMREQYFADEADYATELRSEIDRQFEQETQELINSELSIQELERAESKIRSKNEEEYARRMLDYSMNWLSLKLISHENDDMRKLVSRMVAEPYILSRYHRKTGVVLTESDRYQELVPRALNELRAGILEGKIAEVKMQIATATDNDKCIELMEMLVQLQNQLKNFALCNGERILSIQYKH